MQDSTLLFLTQLADEYDLSIFITLFYPLITNPLHITGFSAC